MEEPCKIEPDIAEWLSHEDFTRSMTSDSNFRLEDVVATENSMTSFTATLEDLRETRISPETLRQFSDVGVKLESLEDESISESYPQAMRVTVKLEDEDIESENSSLAYSQFGDVNVKLEAVDSKVENTPLSCNQLNDVNVSEAVDNKVEKSSHTCTQFSDIIVKLEGIDSKAENSSHTCTQFSDVIVKLEDKDSEAENSSLTCTQFSDVSVKLEDEDNKAENSVHTVSQFNDVYAQSIDDSVRIQLEDTITTDLSSEMSSLGTQSQEPCNVDKEAQSCKTISEGPVTSSSLGSEVTSIVWKNVQDNDVDSCDQSLNDGLHEAIQIEIDVDETTDSCMEWQETGIDFLNNHDTTLEHLSTNYKIPDQRFDVSVTVTDQPKVDTKSQTSASTQLQNHSTIQTGEWRHKCVTCGKAFPKNSNLQYHIRTHTGEKPHKCDTCGMAFLYKSSLHVHIRTHTGEKPYTCMTCGKAFTYKNNLQQHISTHTGEKPYKCVTCGKALTYKSSLQYQKIQSVSQDIEDLLCLCFRSVLFESKWSILETGQFFNYIFRFLSPS